MENIKNKEKERLLLDVKDLYVSFDTYAGEVQAVRGVTFHVNRGETLAIVGESGCGKSVTAQTVMQLIPMPPGRIKGGNIFFEGKDLSKYSDKQMEKVRGKDISMIFQDPMTSLNPTMKIGKQIMEGLMKHQKLPKDEAKKRAIEMLKLVGLPNPGKRADQYPHEFSGGMRQRAMIAIALACNPKLLIADEPTTALDVTIQAQIMELMKDLQVKLDTAIILITHDLGVVAEVCDEVAVMYAGHIVEKGSAYDVFNHTLHPYTEGLFNSLPNLRERGEELVPIKGMMPDPMQLPTGCVFAPRCPYVMDKCRLGQPELKDHGQSHFVACIAYDSEDFKLRRNS